MDINAKFEKDGSTPLHWVWKCDQVKTTKELLSHEVDVNSRNEVGDTPLHSATTSGRQGRLKLLLDRGADISAKNKLTGETPIQYAARYCHSRPDAVLWTCGKIVSHPRPIARGFLSGIQCSYDFHTGQPKPRPGANLEMKPLRVSEEQVKIFTPCLVKKMIGVEWVLIQRVNSLE